MPLLNAQSFFDSPVNFYYVVIFMFCMLAFDAIIVATSDPKKYSDTYNTGSSGKLLFWAAMNLFLINLYFMVRVGAQAWNIQRALKAENVVAPTVNAAPDADVLYQPAGLGLDMSF
jgi:hypothetical protein